MYCNIFLTQALESQPEIYRNQKRLATRVLFDPDSI